MQAVKQKEQLYHYMTQELQNLVCVYNKEEWSQLKKLGEISQELYKEKNDIIEELSTITGRMVKEYFTCVDFREEEGKLVGYVNDIEKLKQVFLQFMIPFYPYYYKELSEGGLRYTALLHPNTLRLFQQLTGKKFRPGYRNRYSTGVRAFEWDKDRYKVYGKDCLLYTSHEDYIYAAIVTGSKTSYILRKYMLPNIIPTLIITAATDIGGMMLELAGLSFLGFGAKAPAAEWGLMLNEGRTYMQNLSLIHIFRMKKRRFLLNFPKRKANRSIMK